MYDHCKKRFAEEWDGNITPVLLSRLSPATICQLHKTVRSLSKALMLDDGVANSIQQHHLDVGDAMSNEVGVTA